MISSYKFTYDDYIDEMVSLKIYDEEGENNNKENIKRIGKILSLIIQRELTNNQRKIFNMYYYENLNMAQISQEMGKNKSTISRSLKRSREKIKNYMQYNSFRR